MKTKINWGMIGSGDVTEKKSSPAFNKIENSALVGVMNRTREKAESFAERHGIPRVFGTATELINDPAINAIYIATPPSSHLEYAVQAMKEGKPVYVEKPMAATYQECVEMNRVSKETGVPLFVAYYRRSLDYFQKVGELLAGNVIGKPYLCQSSLFIQAREVDYVKDDLPWRVIPEISGGGYFHDMGCHELDILLFLLGKIKSIHGLSANNGKLYRPEDTIIASAAFESGLLYNGAWCFASSKESECDLIVVTGEKGSIRFSCFGFTPIEVITKSGKTEYSVESPENIQYPMIKSIVEELQGTGKSPSHGDTAARVNQLMEEILAG